MRENCFVVFKTRAGWIGLAGTSLGLTRSTLPCASEEEAAAGLGADARSHDLNPAFFKILSAKYLAYFEGEKTDFDEAIDLSGYTPFQRQVWEATRLIRYGQIRSYGWIAQQILRPQSPRAVGQALGRNPLPVIVPCHRVLAADGSLGGFSGGLAAKQLLLRIESGRSS